jgi:glyoxylase-like metal-dependent hydrolase (beta-lactamase superfamily II)
VHLSAHCFAVTGLAYMPPWSVNAGFVCGEETTLIIDTGATATSAQTIHGYANAARPSNHLVVINTEKHFDHLGGNSYFRRLGIDVYGHALARRSAEEFESEIAEFAAHIANPARRAHREERVFYHATELANPNCRIDGEREFDLGGCAAQVLLTPGHTPSNLSVYVPEDSVLFCGDCLIAGYLPNLDAGALPDWQHWLGSLERIENLAPRTVVAGHGPVAAGDEVPRMIGRVREAIQKAIEQGRSPTG